MTGVLSGLLAAAFAPFVAWWGAWAALAARAAALRRRGDSTVPRRFHVVVPAHDEEARVGALVRSLRDQEGGSTVERIVVVADHCSDDTAGAARAAGAEVLVRDTGAPGKPPALRAGIDLLRAGDDPADGVVLLDGDCVVGRRFADALARRMLPGVQVVQAAYTLAEPATDAVRSNLRLAFSLRNVVRAAGADGLGLPVVLSGSGMLFRWAALDLLSFGDPRIAGTGDTRPVADDVLMALDLLASGIHVRFARDATVEAPTPDDDRGLGAQRLRWEAGQALMWRRIPGTALAAARRGDWRGVLGLVDWTAPPLVPTVVAAAGASAVVVGAVAAGAAAPWVLVLPAASGALLGTYLVIGVGVLEGPAGVRRLATSVPRFMAWKVRLYAGHRTARRASPGAAPLA